VADFDILYATLVKGLIDIFHVLCQILVKLYVQHLYHTCYHVQIVFTLIGFKGPTEPLWVSLESFESDVTLCMVHIQVLPS